MHLPGPKLDDATKSDIQQKLVNLVVKLVFHHFIDRQLTTVRRQRVPVAVWKEAISFARLSKCYAVLVAMTLRLRKQRRCHVNRITLLYKVEQTKWR